MHQHLDALDVAAALRPADPVTLLRPHAALAAGQYFATRFPGRSLYAVKANPSPDLLRLLWDAGITHYDVASIVEVRLVAATLPQATLCFMHPVKSREAIREAYHDHGVRTFSLDSLAELDKIIEVTGGADDLNLLVRLRVSSDHAKLSLAAKFGADPAGVAPLLMAARQAADGLGICFHVGSQAMSPAAYTQALDQVRVAIVAAGVTVDIIDVGGGFPARYPGMEPPPLDQYFRAIEDAFEALPVSYSAELWCEPGRALAAEYASLLVRVEQRRGDELFITDGAYGALFDAAHLGWRFPVRRVRVDGRAVTAADGDARAFRFYGPTCDDMDHMAGPFVLPDDTDVGDYIEIGMLGAYGCALRTGFNGFGAATTTTVVDAPMLTAYGARGGAADGGGANVVPLRTARG